MLDWDRQLLPVFLALLLFKRSLNIQELHLSKLVIKMGAILKTETRREACEADCGSGKALPYRIRDRQAGTARVPWIRALERILQMMIRLVDKYSYLIIQILAHGLHHPSQASLKQVSAATYRLHGCLFCVIDRNFQGHSFALRDVYVLVGPCFSAWRRGCFSSASQK